MKKGFKILYSLLFAAVALSTASCSEDIMDKVNNNENNSAPGAVPSKVIFTDVQNQLAVNIVGGDLSFYALTYIEHEVGIFNQMYNAEVRSNEPSSSTTYNNSWGTIYANLETLRQIKVKCTEGNIDEGSKLNLGVAQVMTALYLGVLADNWGDAPWSEALSVLEGGIYQPKIDKQKDIYTDIFKNLEDAIINLSTTEYGKNPLDDQQDMIYGKYAGIKASGDRAAAYLKFAYSLKARYLMRQSKVEPKYAEVLDAVEKGFKSSSEEAKVSLFNGNTAVSPYAAFFDSRDYMGCSKSLFDNLTARNDPRVSELVISEATAKVLKGYQGGLAPNGEPEQTQGKYSLPMAALDGSAPVCFMTYHELMFIKAEAILRSNGSMDDAKAALTTAVTSSMDKVAATASRVEGTTAIDATAIATYLENEVYPRFETNALNEVLIQKYFGLYQTGESLEAYADVRRNVAMGNNVYGFKNKFTAKFPLRFSYGASDVTTNNNVKDAYGDGSYVYTDNVWWAGGTR